jgi:hypothetical protein
MQISHPVSSFPPYIALFYFPPSAYLTLLSGQAEQVHQYLTSKDTPVIDGAEALRWLRAHRPSVLNEVLCVMYGIILEQRARDFSDSEFERAHAEWIVSAEPDSIFARNFPAIPSSASLTVARALAVRELCLDTLFLEPMLDS